MPSTAHGFARLTVFTGLLAIIAGFGFGADFLNTQDPHAFGVNIDESELSRSKVVAADALPSFLRALPENTQKLMGLLPVDGVALSAHPVPEIRISIEELVDKNSAPDLEKLLEKQSDVVRWPVEDRAKEKEKTGMLSLQTTKIKGEWKATDLDNSVLSQRVRHVRGKVNEREKVPLIAFYLLSFPGLHVDFVGFPDSDLKRQLVPIIGRKGMPFELGKTVQAREVLSWAKEEAVKQVALRRKIQNENRRPGESGGD